MNMGQNQPYAPGLMTKDLRNIKKFKKYLVSPNNFVQMYQTLWQYKDESIFQDVYNQTMKVIKFA